jgi:hypothetical protein
MESVYKKAHQLLKRKNMRVLFASLLFVSLAASANDILKVTDGSVALCKNKVDVLSYRTSLVYRPLSFVRGEEVATLKIEFLRCVQKGSKFFFERDRSVTQREVKIEPGPFSPEETTVRIERSELDLTVFQTTARVLSRTSLKRNADHTYSAQIPIEMTSYETDVNGESFFEMNVSSKMKVVDLLSERMLDSKTEWLGSYRVFLK